MEPLPLERMFRPASVAVVTSGDPREPTGAAVVENLRSGGFAGPIHVIGPTAGERGPLPDYRKWPAAPDGPVDLVVAAVPAGESPSLIRAAGEMGAAGVILLGAGAGGETDAPDPEAIRKAARRAGVRVIGPGCVGLAVPRVHLNAGFARHMPPAGPTAFLSQSASIYTALLDLSRQEKFGFRYFVNLGAMSDLDFADMLDFLGNDPEVGSIVMYMEHLKRFREFMSAARSVSRVKPVIVLKAGRTAPGAQAAASHTGVLAGEDAMYDAAFQRAGIVRVKDFEALFDVAELLSRRPRQRGARLAVVTNAGGPGVLAADALADAGLAPAKLSETTLERLDREFAPATSWPRANPVDILAPAPPVRYVRTVDICLAADEVDAVLVILAPHATSLPTETAESLVTAFGNRPVPLYTCWMGGPDVAEGRAILNRAGIPTFDTPERAIRAFATLHRHSELLEILQQVPRARPRRLNFDHDTARRIIDEAVNAGRSPLMEIESKALLEAYGIPVNPTRLAETGDAAWRLASEMGFPVVLKIHSPDISHKSDADGVSLDLQTEFEVYGAFRRIMENAHRYAADARIPGVTVQPMIRDAHCELIAGIKRDPHFGPVLVFGMGGMLTEVIADRSLALPPLNQPLARRMMAETRVFQVLRGYRHLPPADLTRMEEILVRLSRLACDFPEITELDINPLIVTRDLIRAVDARVVLARSPVAAPGHLVISPYPDHHESDFATNAGEPAHVRPIRPEDAPLLEGMFQRLSPRSVYLRFFSPMKTLRRDMLIRLTQIDYDREIALVALSPGEYGEEMMGLGQIVTTSDRSSGEFAMLIRDDCQGKGIGAELLGRCLDIARTHGLKRVEGLVMPENTGMLALGRKLGFEMRRSLDSGEYRLVIDL